MIGQRLRLILLSVPIILALIIIGGWPFALGFAVALALAAVEFGQLFRMVGRRPALPLLVVAAAGLPLARLVFGFYITPELLSALLLLAMAWHVVDYETGADGSGSDFALTVGGGLYIGWTGAYLISLRQLEGGTWWVIQVLGTVWLTDIAAYLGGSRFGRRAMAARLSPSKTWEGYLSGVIFGSLGGAGLAGVLASLAGASSSIMPGSGLILGLALSIITPLGDLGISMIKRQVAAKDTGSSLPGHGGFLDRMDTWLWGAVIGFYTVSLLD